MKAAELIGEATMKHLTGPLVRDTAWSGVTNPKNAARRLRDAGIELPAEDLLRAADLHRKRSQRLRIDPLKLAQHTRERRLAEYKRLKGVRSAAMYPFWRADFRRRVEHVARYSDVSWKIDREAQRASMEAIVRACRKMGWQVRHTSQHNGRASSRYIIVPGRGEARLSDHEIPETAERSWRRAEGTYAPRWNGEVIIGDEWRTVRLTTWLRRILLAAAGR